MPDESLQGLGEVPRSYSLYSGDVELFFDASIHQYTTYTKQGLVVVPGVTTITHIIDKSAALMQWAANMAVQYIADNAENSFNKALTVGDFITDLKCADSEFLRAAKYAHREHKETAANIGSISHDHIEQYIRAAIRGSNADMLYYRDNMPENQQSANGVIAAFNWMDRHSVKWIFTEKKIYSREHNYAGTADGLALVSSCGDKGCCLRLLKQGEDYYVAQDNFNNVLAVPDWKTSNSIYPEYFYQTAAYSRAFAEEYPGKYVAKHRFINRLGKDDAKFESVHRGPDTAERDDRAFLACLALHNAVEEVKYLEREDKAEIKAAIKREKAAEKEAEKSAKSAEKDRLKKVKAFIKAGLSEEEAERQSLVA